MPAYLTERQRELLKGHRWTREMCLDFEGGGLIVDRCDALKIFRRISSPKVKGRWGDQEVTYGIAGDDREFSSIAELAAALEEKGLL